MNTDNRTNEARNSDMSKTDKDRAAGDPYANQGGGKLGSGNENSGHPANNVIVPSAEHAREETARARGSARVATGVDSGNEAGTKGSGMPIVSGAGQLLDDRPGRDDPKSQRSN
jgi:hypothetical protein